MPEITDPRLLAELRPAAPQSSAGRGTIYRNPQQPYDVQRAAAQAASAQAEAPFAGPAAAAQARKTQAEATRIEQQNQLGPAGQTWTDATTGYFAKRYGNIMDQADSAREMLAMYDAVEDAMKSGVRTGFGAEAELDLRRFGQMLGLDVDQNKTSGGELIRSIQNRMALIMRSPNSGGGMPGQVSDRDIKFLKDSQVGLDRSPEGNARLLRAFRAVEQRKIDVADLADKYVTEHGRLDTGFNQVVRDYAAGNALQGVVDRAPRNDTETTLNGNGIPTVTDQDERLRGLLQGWLDSGYSIDEATRAAKSFGWTGRAQGGRIADPGEWNRALEYNRAHPDSARRASIAPIATGGPARDSAMNRIATTPAGGALGGYLGGASAGLLDEGVGAIDSLMTGRPMDDAINDANFKRGIVAGLNPTASFAGNVAGGFTGLLGGGAALGKFAPQVARRLGGFAPIAGDVAFGALTGGGESNDSRIFGALTGAGAAAGGGVIGRKIGARTARTDIPPPTSGERAVVSALNRTGRDQVADALARAADLGVPASPADVSPEIGSLVGAAIRRSPTVAGDARAALGSRARGQIDRFSSAVERDLGPTTNVDIRSDEITRAAREASGPAYERAYAGPVVSSPVLDDLLGRPSGRAALARAQKIMADEGVDSRAAGFAVDADGNVVLNPVDAGAHARVATARAELDDATNDLDRIIRRAQGGNAGGGRTAAEARVQTAREAHDDALAGINAVPTPGTAATQTGYTPQAVDYVKRGLDDMLDEYRDAFGNIHLDTAGRAIDGIRRDLLREIDQYNPDYSVARALFAGPASQRDALRLGKQAVGMSPSSLEAGVRGFSPSQMDQAQLGFQSGLIDRANDLRYSTNPFGSVLDTPGMERRLTTIYPGRENDIARLLSQRDMERDLASSTNRLIGNSMTAERQVADEAFAGDPVVQALVDVGANVALGQVPIGTAIRQATGQRARDAMRLGLGARATRRAEEIAPIALNTDPAAASMALDDIARRWAEREAAVAPARALGGQAGVAAALAGLNRR